MGHWYFFKMTCDMGAPTPLITFLEKGPPRYRKSNFYETFPNCDINNLATVTFNSSYRNLNGLISNIFKLSKVLFCTANHFM